jgi:hypothetical protein
MIDWVGYHDTMGGNVNNESILAPRILPCNSAAFETESGGELGVTRDRNVTRYIQEFGRMHQAKVQGSKLCPEFQGITGSNLGHISIRHPSGILARSRKALHSGPSFPSNPVVILARLTFIKIF